MAPMQRSVTLVKVLGTIVLAIAIICGLIYLLGGDDTPHHTDRPGAPGIEQIPPVRYKRMGDAVTEIRFPQQARSDCREVNLFVSHFLDILIADDYKTYRLRVTRRRRPVGRETFEHAGRKAELIEVKSITKVEKVSGIKLPALKGIDPPVYRVQAFVALRDGRKRTVDLYVFKESGKWVSSH